MRRHLWAVILFALPMASCTLSQTDSEKGFAAVSAALSAASAGAQSQANGPTVTVNFTYNCPSGGSVTLNGTLDEDSSSGMSTFDYSADFNHCVENGITISGSLTFKDTFTPNGSSGGTIALTYDGSVSFSGSVNGACVINTTGTSTITSNANGMGSLTYSYTGTICGNSASVVGSASF